MSKLQYLPPRIAADSFFVSLFESMRYLQARYNVMLGNAMNG